MIHFRCYLCVTCLLVILLIVCSRSVASDIPQVPVIAANENRIPAGRLEGGVLTINLKLTSGDWYPEAEGGSSMKVDAFAEVGRTPEIPGPLIRVIQGTEIHATFHNLLPATAIIHGIHKHPGDAKDTLQVPSGQTIEVRFLAGEVGTYQYFASAGGEMNRGRPFRDDSQLHGAFIVDPLGAVVRDRVFVIGAWRSEATPGLSKDITVINGKSWPYTELLNYTVGQEVRWRWINASDLNHPMHLHGSYYRVDSVGDGEHDQILALPEQQTVVTRLISPGSTITTRWSPVAGRWIFHCHIMGHIAPSRTVANANSTTVEPIHEHGTNHMAGLVLGITVTGNRPKVVSQGRRRKLRLLVRQRRPINGLPAGFAYQLEGLHGVSSDQLGVPGPPVILERGRPVEITVVNQLLEPTAVHWHGMELESYYDDVPGWGMRGTDLTPAIEPGQSFAARFTPRAGTFIYHTHLNDELQLAGGLYGPLVVLEPGTKFDSKTDQIFIIGGWGGPRSKDPRTLAAIVLNGSGHPPTLHWRVGQRYRLRLIDISSANVGTLSVSGAGGFIKWVARAKDGADLPQNQRVRQDANQVISPGETYDFEYAPQERGSLALEFKTVLLSLKVRQAIEVE